MTPALADAGARRILAVWLPRFAIDRRDAGAAAERPRPFVLIQHQQQKDFIFSVNDEAEKFGIVPGIGLSDARALCLNLAAAPAEPDADRRALERLADWCGRYTPWVAVDPAIGQAEAGLLLDIAGCAHRFGGRVSGRVSGEAGLLADLARRLTRARLRHRLAVADAPGTAWAWSRFGPVARRPILAPGEAAAALPSLPVEALRLAAAESAALQRLGLRRIADLMALPRAALAARFGERLLRRLDEALGHCREPIAPRRPATDYATRRDFVEPLLVPAGLAPTLARLLVRLCRRLERDGLGARQLVCTVFRLDGTASSAAIGTSRPARDPAHLMKLFAPKLEALDPDPGIETMLLEAPDIERAGETQQPFATLDRRASAAIGNDVAALIDRLVNRLGAGAVHYMAPQPDHVPERQWRRVPALSAAPPDWSAWPRETRALPQRLLPRPEPLAAVELGPDGAPSRFIWRRRIFAIASAAGPDRRLGAWWRGEDAARDYWTIADSAGRAASVFRCLRSNAWFLQGLGVGQRKHYASIVLS